MVSVDGSGYVRISNSDVQSAGFQPGNSLAAVPNGSNSVSLVPVSKGRRNDAYFECRVEQDGRVRFQKSRLSEIGVRGRRKNMEASVTRKNITITV